jgi:hypothetical protein
MSRYGVGPISAAQTIAGFSHPGRYRNEAAFAAWFSGDLRLDSVWIAGMTENSAGDSREDDESPAPPLPENLAALIGAVQGPADLGRNHDKYLA